MSEQSDDRPFCHKCQQVVAWCHDPGNIAKGGSIGKFQHHRTIIGFKASAKTCPFCAILIADYDPKLHSSRILAPKLTLNRMHSGNTSILCCGKKVWKAEHILPDPGKDNSSFPRWTDANPTARDRLQVVKRWLQQCQAGGVDHRRCNASSDGRSPILPKRFLDVDSGDVTSVKLVDAARLDPSSIAGVRSRNNLSRRRQTLERPTYAGIPLADLPQTYRDAVFITRELGVRYLWIDSLCIVQGDAFDWEIESGKMSAVYSHSYLTIAATSSRDSSGGCFPIDSATFTITRGICSRKEPNSGPSQSYPVVVRSGPRNGVDSVGNAPLNKRGWVLQELALSPRTVHFTGSDMYWQCRSRQESEDGTVFSSSFSTISFGKFADHDLSTPALASKFWHLFVSVFGGLQFTKWSDRAPAIAGVVKYFQEATDMDPVLGCWLETLWFDLAWQMHSDKGKCSRGSQFPSWSWLSLEQPKGLYYLLKDNPQSMLRRLQVVKWTIKWKGVPYTSELQSCELVVRNPLKMTVPLRHPEYDCYPYIQSRNVLRTPNYVDPNIEEFWAMDQRTDEIKKDPVFALLLCTRPPQYYEAADSGHEYFLILEQDSIFPSKYRRIGVGCRNFGQFESGGRKSLFSDVQEDSVITLT